MKIAHEEAIQNLKKEHEDNQQKLLSESKLKLDSQRSDIEVKRNKDD